VKIVINFSPVSCEVKPYRKAADVILLLIILPCLLSLINLNFAQNWKIHFFSAAIILAAVVFGAGGGLLAGLTGSLYSALFLGNPYILVGNALFGLLAGVFYKKTGKIIPAVLLAYLGQLPWLILSDYYFVHLPAIFIAKLAIVLFLTNAFWAALIHLSLNPIKKLFSC
jgi:uncharacterized membrane protein